MLPNKRPELLSIGISSQSRLLPQIQAMLKDAGYPSEFGKEKSLILPDSKIKLVLVKGIEEIAYRVENLLTEGLIIGSDIAEEVNLILSEEARKNNQDEPTLLKLQSMADTGKAQAKLATLAPKDMDPTDLIKNPKLILSKYSLVAQREMGRIQSPETINIKAREVESQADVLAGETSQLAYDIVDTGKTMREAGLKDISGFSEEVGQDIWFEIPASIPTSLQVFGTRRSAQTNQMIDFVQSLKI